MGRNLNSVGERRSAELAEVNRYHAVFYSTHLFGDGSRSVKFHSMPLAVIEAEGERLEPLVLGDGECGGGVESTAQ